LQIWHLGFKRHGAESGRTPGDRPRPPSSLSPLERPVGAAPGWSSQLESSSIHSSGMS